MSSKLLQNDIEAIYLDQIELRDVLNAAWSCRVDQKGDMNDIAMVAKKLCERIYAKNCKRERGHEIYSVDKLDSRSSMQG